MLMLLAIISNLCAMSVRFSPKHAQNTALGPSLSEAAYRAHGQDFQDWCLGEYMK